MSPLSNFKCSWLPSRVWGRPKAMIIYLFNSIINNIIIHFLWVIACSFLLCECIFCYSVVCPTSPLCTICHIDETKGGGKAISRNKYLILQLLVSFLHIQQWSMWEPKHKGSKVNFQITRVKNPHYSSSSLSVFFGCC